MMVELHPSPQQPCFHVSRGFLLESAGSSWAEGGWSLPAHCLHLVVCDFGGLGGGDLLQPGPEA